MSLSPNRRFHQLADQCWNSTPIGDFDYVKFGQLVVAECVMHTDRLDNPCAALLLQLQICEHFGIAAELGQETEIERDQQLTECDQRLLALLGSSHLVERWWQTPNSEFGMVTPLQVWLEQPNEVLDYLRRF